MIRTATISSQAALPSLGPALTERQNRIRDKEFRRKLTREARPRLRDPLAGDVFADSQLRPTSGVSGGTLSAQGTAPPLPNEQWPPLRRPFSFGIREGLNLHSRAAPQARIEAGMAGRHNLARRAKGDPVPVAGRTRRSPRHHRVAAMNESRHSISDYSKIGR